MTINESQVSNQARKSLEEFSEATGGFFFVPEKLSSLGIAAGQIALDIRRRYSLEYTSTHAQKDGKLHKVEIRSMPVTNVSKIKPLFRQEYYAPSH
jgi:hypothetical protein